MGPGIVNAPTQHIRPPLAKQEVQLKGLIMQKAPQKSVLFALLLAVVFCLMTACSNTSGSGSTPPTIGVTPTTAAQVHPTSTPVTTTPTEPALPFLGIRMLDTTHGWALTASQILKTADGGTSWQDVTPSKAGLNVFSKGDFYNSQYAWIVSPPQDENSDKVFIWHTTNGGQSWNDSMITTAYSAGADYPHFLSTTNGWLQLLGSPGAGQRPSAVYHTTDGGQSWTQVTVQATGKYPVIRANGLSLKDAQNIWITGDASADEAATTLPPVDVSHDGGVTWQTQTVPALKASNSGGLAVSTPPVFFGNNAIMPIERAGSDQVTLVLYISRNGGQSWSATTALNIATTTALSVYVVNPQYAWATTGNSVYATTDGGESWSMIGQVPSIGAISFVNPTTGWAIGNPTSQTNKQNILEKTIDGGKTWQKINYIFN
jgi:photosystem II stability/assembly factor-like uncharacterized protein